jgi:hypothetical protein
MDKLAREFIAKLRAHGHRPYVDGRRIGIMLSVSEPCVSPDPCHLGPDRSYPLGFDLDPFVELLQDRTGAAADATTVALEARQ